MSTELYRAALEHDRVLLDVDHGVKGLSTSLSTLSESVDDLINSLDHLSSQSEDTNEHIVDHRYAVNNMQAHLDEIDAALGHLEQYAISAQDSLDALKDEQEKIA